MSLSYNKLFVLMKEKGITTYVIRKENIISQSAFYRYNRTPLQMLKLSARRYYGICPRRGRKIKVDKLSTFGK